MRAPFLADDVVRWLYRAPASVRESTDCAAAVIGRRPELLAIPTDRGELGTKRLSVGGVSRRALIKAEYFTSHGAPDWLARLSASVPAPLLETRFLGVDKFHHFRFWMRRDLSGYVRDVLIGDHGDLGEWFNMSRVSDMVDEHIDGRANYTTEIDKLLTIALAKKMFFEKVKHVQCR
jgi:asparagine synthase (glutamine-hydrolysing)